MDKDILHRVGNGGHCGCETVSREVLPQVETPAKWTQEPPCFAITIGVRLKSHTNKSFVASNFNYCPLVWHFCGVSNSNKMEKIQERCLRIVYKDYDSSYDRLLAMANTVSLVIWRLRILLLEVYKSKHHLNPMCISGLFEVKATNYSLRNPVKFVQPMKRTSTYGLRPLSYTGAKLWNDLSPLLSNDVEIEDFKSLTTILSTDHFNPTFTYV